MDPTPNTQALCRVLVILDGESEDMLDVVELQGFDLNAFAEQFDVALESDPHMLDRYAVGPDDAAFVNDHLDAVMAFDFARRAYFIEAATRE